MATITGKVVAGDTLKPLSDCVVSIDDAVPNVSCVVTDDEGNFTATVDERDTPHAIHVEREGFAPLTDSAVVPRLTGVTSKLLALRPVAASGTEARPQSGGYRVPDGMRGKLPPPTEPVLQFFKFDHLPPAMQAVSKPFCELAAKVVANLPRNPERSAALRKLLEAKDCAVRATIWKDA